MHCIEDITQSSSSTFPEHNCIAVLKHNSNLHQFYMLSHGHLRQLAASAAHAEVALLRTAPALLEALSQRWHLLSSSSSNGTVSTCYQEEATIVEHNNNSSRTDGSGSSRPLAVGSTWGATSTPSSQLNSSLYIQRPYSSSSAAIDDNASVSSASAYGQDQQQQQQRQDAYRRGFGAKVALPSTDVLHEVLVGHAATVRLRAYHLGTAPHTLHAKVMSNRLL
jgi:hypothetical protein